MSAALRLRNILLRWSRGMAVATLTLTVAGGCLRGTPSEKPPIHIVPNMDWQPKAQPQASSTVFANGAAMQLPVPGTVARGRLQEDTAYYTGKDAAGALIRKSPVPLTMALLERGQERYDIYCSPCHSRVGDGRGIMIQYNYPPPTDLRDERIRDIEDGYLFDTMTNGIRNMPAYGSQVPVADRWAIIAYIRALGRTQIGTSADLPAEVRSRFE